MPLEAVLDLPQAQPTHRDDWQSLIDALSTSTVIIDRGLVFLAQNSAHEAMTGARREDVVGKRMFDVFPVEPDPTAPNAEDAIRTSVDLVCRTGAADTLPIQHHALRKPDGTWQPHAWKVTHAPIKENGQVVAILQTSEDVTAQSLANALETAHRQSAQDAAGVSYFSYDLVTQQFERAASVDDLFGFAPGEAGPLAGPFFERMHPGDLPAVEAELARIEQAPLGTQARFDYRIAVPELDDHRVLRARGAMVIDPIDRKKKLVGVFMDMTDTVRIRQDLEQALMDKENLLVEVNHRVKNSLQMASSILRMEARRAGDESAQQVLKTANDRVDAIAEVHGGLYLGGDVTCAPIALVQKRIVEALARSVGAGETSAEIEGTAADFTLPTDQAIAFGLLVNELLTNAVKHGGVAGADPIRVHTALAGDRVTLTVSNDLPPDGVAAAEPGTGVGMSLINGFVRQLQGEITTEATANRFVARVTFDI